MDGVILELKRSFCSFNCYYRSIALYDYSVVLGDAVSRF